MLSLEFLGPMLMHGSASCTKKSSFEAVVEVSDKEARREVTLEEDMDITLEPNIGAGKSER